MCMLSDLINSNFRESKLLFTVLICFISTFNLKNQNALTCRSKKRLTGVPPFSDHIDVLQGIQSQSYRVSTISANVRRLII